MQIELIRGLTVHLMLQSGSECNSSVMSSVEAFFHKILCHLTATECDPQYTNFA